MRLGWTMVISCALGVSSGCTVDDSVVPLTGESATGGTADGTTDGGRDDGDSRTSGVDGPQPAECQSSGDCEGFCSYCEAGVCVEDVGCCSTQREDEFGFRCSEEGPWDDGEDDGPPSTTGATSGGTDGGSSGGTDGETDSTTAGTDTAGTDTGETETGASTSASGAGMGVVQ